MGRNLHDPSPHLRRLRELRNGVATSKLAVNYLFQKGKPLPTPA
ncbi:hypothetical protein ACE7GA_09605 [Roseomonas sp. CCTCC AB2023176]